MPSEEPDVPEPAKVVTRPGVTMGAGGDGGEGGMSDDINVGSGVGRAVGPSVIE